eukprot:SAG11_NODE_563_length_8516_cov_11.669122_5_plen_94_part_00
MHSVKMAGLVLAVPGGCRLVVVRTASAFMTTCSTNVSFGSASPSPAPRKNTQTHILCDAARSVPSVPRRVCRRRTEDRHPEALEHDPSGLKEH